MLEQGASLAEPALHGAGGHLDHLGELLVGEPLPVRQLEQRLQLDRQRPQRAQQQLLLLALGDAIGRRVLDLQLPGSRRGERVELAMSLAPVVEEHVPCDREQIGAEARAPGEVVDGLDAREERLLHEIVGAVLHLVREEAMHGLEVTLDERVASLGISAAPCREQRFVGHCSTSAASAAIVACSSPTSSAWAGPELAKICAARR